MFKGYVEFGGVEVVNVARLVKYVAEGGAPVDLRLAPMVGDYTDLPAALGDGPYRTALLDAPPWYDATNPDSALFSGLLPLSIDNLDGSTRSRNVTEGLGAGGRPSRSRPASRVVPVTVLAIGAGDAALDAGIAWLTGVLHPPCATGSEGCRGAALDLFSAAPVYCDNTPNLDADLIEAALIAAPVTRPGPSVSYFDLSGSYLDPACGEVTVSATVSSDDALDGLSVTLALVDTAGTLFAETTTSLPGDGGEVTVTVSVEPSPGFPAQWQPILYWYGPAIIDAGDVDDGIEDVIDGGGSDPLPDLIDGGDTDGPWGMGDAYGGTIMISEWTYSQPPALTVDECLSELRRSYRNVVTVDGPHVTEELQYENGEPYAAKVEWTWVATDPILYGDTADLVRGMLVGHPGYSSGAVHVASVENVPLFVPPTGVYYIDGVVYGNGIFPIGGGDGGPFVPLDFLNLGDRVLLKDQDDPAQNGIYIYNGPGAYFTRATDCDTWAEVVTAEALVLGGDTNSFTVWGTDVSGGGTIDVTAMPWEAIPGTPSGYDEGVVYRAAGLQIADNVEVDGGDTSCPVPSLLYVLCGDDPDLPPVVAPPAPPTLADPGMPTIGEYVRRELQVPPELSPQPGAVLTFRITNLGEDPYRGIRVRIWADPDPDFGVSDECGFETEFYITYLEAGQTVTIDGPDHTVSTTCLSGLDDDHERNMRGPYGGPFVFPEFRCGERYHVAVDVPNDDPGGGVSVDLAVTRRTG